MNRLQRWKNQFVRWLAKPIIEAERKAIYESAEGLVQRAEAESKQQIEKCSEAMAFFTELRHGFDRKSRQYQIIYRLDGTMLDRFNVNENMRFIAQLSADHIYRELAYSRFIIEPDRVESRNQYAGRNAVSWNPQEPKP